MKISRTNLLSLALVVLPFVLAAVLYSRLPELTLTHWHVRGQVNRYISKPWGPFALPLLMAGVYLVFLAIPRISPRGYRVERFKSAFETTQVGVLTLLFLANVLALLAGVGVPVPVPQAVHAGLGLFLVLTGNFIGKFTKNFFLGIRTPWTLASDEVWLRTHRLAGKLLVLAGVAVFVLALTGLGAEWTLAVIGVAIGIPVVYSYFLYRRIEGFKNGTHDHGAPHA